MTWKLERQPTIWEHLEESGTEEDKNTAEKEAELKVKTQRGEKNQQVKSKHQQAEQSQKQQLRRSERSKKKLNCLSGNSTTQLGV